MSTFSPSAALRRLVRCFLAGVFAILPVVITVAVIMWIGGFVRQYVGPGTLIGSGLLKLGLAFVSNDTIAYLIGIVVVLAVIFAVGVAVESGARNLIQRLQDALLQRIPLVRNLYGTSKQVVGMLDRQDESTIKGMQVVFYRFGQEASAGVLALLVSPERFRINGADYQIIIVPTAPVPIGGGLLFVPADMVQRTDMSAEGLMSIYVSMGITAKQFLKPDAAASATMSAPTGSPQDASPRSA
jgi:uncharacterized membrane protein